MFCGRSQENPYNLQSLGTVINTELSDRHFAQAQSINERLEAIAWRPKPRVEKIEISRDYASPCLPRRDPIHSALIYLNHNLVMPDGKIDSTYLIPGKNHFRWTQFSEFTIAVAFRAFRNQVSRTLGARLQLRVKCFPEQGLI